MFKPEPKLNNRSRFKFKSILKVSEYTTNDTDRLARDIDDLAREIKVCMSRQHIVFAEGLETLKAHLEMLKAQLDR